MELEVNGMPNRDEEGNRSHDENQAISDNVNFTQPDAATDEHAADPPLRRIHSKHHSSGKYKMFSNHSSANDFPRTSTGA